jgi:hypothetical protein
MDREWPCYSGAANYSRSFLLLHNAIPAAAELGKSAVQILDGYESTVHYEPVLTFRVARITDHSPTSFSR